MVKMSTIKLQKYCEYLVETIQNCLSLSKYIYIKIGPLLQIIGG